MTYTARLSPRPKVNRRLRTDESADYADGQLRQSETTEKTLVPLCVMPGLQTCIWKEPSAVNVFVRCELLRLGRFLSHARSSAGLLPTLKNLDKSWRFRIHGISLGARTSRPMPLNFRSRSGTGIPACAPFHAPVSRAQARMPVPPGRNTGELRDIWVCRHPDRYRSGCRQCTSGRHAGRDGRGWPAGRQRYTPNADEPGPAGPAGPDKAVHGLYGVELSVFVPPWLSGKVSPS